MDTLLANDIDATDGKSKYDAQVKKVLEKNKQMRHIRGGIATKNKYLQLREKLT